VPQRLWHGACKGPLLLHAARQAWELEQQQQKRQQQQQPMMTYVWICLPQLPEVQQALQQQQQQRQQGRARLLLVLQLCQTLTCCWIAQQQG
jgi:hypothetical protein